ncbi:MAG: chromosomal replication initiator protein DnaA [Alphaproteobacteria bacterium]|nr:chromosomal replication initiator protein DnaA [Alphaproteobacteria bacterium]
MDVSAKGVTSSDVSTKDRAVSGFGGLSDEKRWEKVRTRLRDEVGEAAFKSWLAPVGIKDVRDGRLRLNAPSRMVRDWVQTHYADRIRALWGAEMPGVHKVEVAIAAPRAKVPPIPDSAPAVVGRNIEAREAAREAGIPAPVLASDAERDSLGAPLDARYTFDNFVVGKPNEFAHAAARRVAESKTPAFNPLFLYGGVGLGKTHLMHAIAWEIRERDPSRSVLYLSAEKFMYRFVRALRHQDIMSFKEQFRSVDVLMIDDVQFISGKDSTQEEFFHTFNALVDLGRQIVVSADKSPSDLEGLEERLRSRLGCGLVADIHATSFELRLGILQSKAEHMGVEVPPKVIEFLAHKITSNVRELEGALRRVAAHAQLVGRPITLENTQEVLHDILRASDRRITIEDIQKRVAEHFNIRLSDMSSARRARAVARPRQVAMYLAKQLTSRSLPEIGRKFGGRDHTTVIHAVRKVEELTSRDAGFAEDVELLRRMLEG